MNRFRDLTVLHSFTATGCTVTLDAASRASFKTALVLTSADITGLSADLLAKQALDATLTALSGKTVEGSGNLVLKTSVQALIDAGLATKQTLDATLTALSGKTISGTGNVVLKAYVDDGLTAGLATKQASDTTLTAITGKAIQGTGDLVLKSYVDSTVANAVTGLYDIKGNLDCSANPNYPVASKGDAYRVSVAGRIGGGSGPKVSVGDTIIAFVDSVGGTHAAVGTDWQVGESNIEGITTLGVAIITQANPAGTSFLQLNANGSITQLDAAGLKSALSLNLVDNTSNATERAAARTLTNATINGANNTLVVRLGADVTGTLPVSNGGSGQTTFSNGQIMIGNTIGNTLTKATLSQGANISIVNGNGSITIGFTGTLPIANGGTGANNQVGALNALLPAQAGNNGKVLATDGAVSFWTTPSGGGAAAFNHIAFCAQDGNDGTAVVGDPGHPFATAQAAVDALGGIGAVDLLPRTDAGNYGDVNCPNLELYLIGHNPPYSGLGTVTFSLDGLCIIRGNGLVSIVNVVSGGVFFQSSAQTLSIYDCKITGGITTPGYVSVGENATPGNNITLYRCDVRGAFIDMHGGDGGAAVDDGMGTPADGRAGGNAGVLTTWWCQMEGSTSSQIGGGGGAGVNGGNDGASGAGGSQTFNFSTPQ